MLRNKNVIIEKAVNPTTGLACIMLFDEYNGVCESLNEDQSHNVSFKNMEQVVLKIQEYQKEGFSFAFRGFGK